MRPGQSAPLTAPGRARRPASPRGRPSRSDIIRRAAGIDVRPLKIAYRAASRSHYTETAIRSFCSSAEAMRFPGSDKTIIRVLIVLAIAQVVGWGTISLPAVIGRQVAADLQ